MDSNKAFATIKRYRTQFAMAALLVFTVLTVGVIYFIRQSSEPLAPTAPTSRPSAQQQACTTDFLLQPECLDLTFNLQEEATQSAEVSTGSAELKPGNRGTFVCEGLPGTTNYKFEYKTSENGSYTQLSSGTASESAALTIGEYIEIKCTTCAGTYCASATNVAQNCTMNATGQILIPSPVPSPVPSPTPSAVPSPTPKTGFVIEKFHDKDGDGGRDDNEAGLTWDFEWRIKGDQSWTAYQTDSNRDGRGVELLGYEDGVVIEIREKGKSGWSSTTSTETSLTTDTGRVIVVQFGNRETVASPTPSQCDSECASNSDCPSNLTCSSGRCRNPECTGESDCSCNGAGSPVPAASPTPELPVSGSTAQTASLLIVGLGVLLLGSFQFWKRSRL